MGVNADGTYTDPGTGLTFPSQAFMNSIAGQQVIAAQLQSQGITNLATLGQSNQIGSQGTVITNSDGSWSLTGGQNSDAQQAYDWAAQTIQKLANQVGAGNLNSSPTVQGLVTASIPSTSTPVAAPTGTGLDLSGVNSIITWISQNILMVIIIAAAVIVLPGLVRATTEA